MGAEGRVREDGEKARTLITSALLGELGRRVLEYENAITWETSCTSCARVLDSAAAETFRREAAEARLEHAVRLAERWAALALAEGPVTEKGAQAIRTELAALRGEAQGGGEEARDA